MSSPQFRFVMVKGFPISLAVSNDAIMNQTSVTTSEAGSLHDSVTDLFKGSIIPRE